ncbi:MAG TPA: trypsin-like peptidase domain-containing protein [Gemmatimonadales bacterium]|nr:trypsin-like peptidase domain-containing protein [Gemmatimonadales bacterium]
MSYGWLHRLRSGGTGIAFLAGLLVAGLLQLPHLSFAQQSDTRPAAMPTQPATVPPAGAATLASLSEAFASVAEHVKPSVVFIKSGKTDRPQRQQFQVPPGFEQFMPRMPQGPQFQESAGSGFIVSKDGYILTNDHVVDGSDQVTVRLLDRREFKAKVVGTDPGTDMAVLKIDADNLTPAPLGDSDASRVGEWVLAVGNPLGENLTFTVTSGIISAKGRSLALPNTSDRSIQDFIQTDAAINPGNSGGPLVSVSGAVIGVNSAIASQTGFYSGYGFAIPINLARRVMDQIIAHGRVQRAALGVTVRNVSPNDAAYVGLPDVRGVVVEDFGGERSPARAAGLEPGDIIVSVDGKPVEYVGQLQQQIAFRRPGESVKIEVARKGGSRKTLEVKLQELPAARTVAQGGDSSEVGDHTAEESAASIGQLGITVAPVDDDDVSQLRLRPDQRGALITDVKAGGPSYGELVGPDQGGPDIILEVEGTPVRSPADLRKALSKEKPGTIVSLRVYNARAQSRRVERIKLGE